MTANTPLTRAINWNDVPDSTDLDAADTIAIVVVDFDQQECRP